MNLLQDLRFAVRLLVKDRWFTAVAVIALALGIGVNATVFTFVNAVLIRGLPFDDPDRIIVVGTRDARDRDRGVSYLDFEDWRAATRTFAGLAAFSGQTMNVSDEGRAPEQFQGPYMSANAFTLIGQQPLLGRDFLPEDDRPGAAAVVILGNGIWKNRYGSDPSVDRPHDQGQRDAGDRHRRDAGGLQVPDQRRSLAAARADAAARRAEARRAQPRGLRTAGRRRHAGAGAVGDEHDRRASWRATIPTPTRTSRARVMTFNERDERRADQADLPVADGRGRLRAADRLRQRRQPAARALGQPRARDVASASRSARRAGASSASCWSRACCCRSSAACSASALASSASGCSTPPRRTSASRTGSSSRWTRSVFAFFAAVCLGTGIVFGLAPALHVSKTDVNEVLKEGGRSGSSGVRARRWTSVLIVVELALTLVLLAGAGFMMRSFLDLYRLDLGVDTSHLLTMRLRCRTRSTRRPSSAARSTSGSTSGSPASAAFKSATITTNMPLGGGFRGSCSSRRTPPAAGEQPPTVTLLADRPALLRDARRAGCCAAARSTTLDGTPGHESAIVNQRFAAMHFGGEDPIGRRIKLRVDGPQSPGAPPPAWVTIVGIAPTDPPAQLPGAAARSGRLHPAARAARRRSPCC